MFEMIQGKIYRRYTIHSTTLAARAHCYKATAPGSFAPPFPRHCNESARLQSNFKALRQLVQFFKGD